MNQTAALDKQQKKIDRDAYVYNTIGGLLMAFQSVVLLMVITRIGDLAMAGVFTIAYANANLFMNVGRYGMRNFQASDTSGSFSFADYRLSRRVTSWAMVIAAVAYLAFSAINFGYTLDKTLVVFVMCLFKVVDTVEDIYHGDYQRNGRLDIAAKIITWRMASTLALFIVLLILTHNLLVSLTITTIFTAAFFIASVSVVKKRFTLPKPSPHAVRRKVLTLLRECFPLFVSAFLLFYIGSAPKYAIDACMGDQAQAIYGFISMPVFVVGLLSGFVYNPIINKLAKDWNQQRMQPFLREIGKQCLAVLLLTVLCVAASWAIGIPVLGWLYNTDLNAYLLDLIILVTGGGFAAFIGLFMAIITIIRFQKSLTIGYVATALFALISSPWIVQSFGIRGAAWEYFILMGILSVLFGVLLVIGIVQKNKKRA